VRGFQQDRWNFKSQGGEFMKKWGLLILLVIALIAMPVFAACAKPAPAPAPAPSPTPTPTPTPTPAPAPEAEPIVIKAICAFPVDHPNSVTVGMFIERVEYYTKGAIKIDLLGGPEVIPAFDAPEAQRVGTIDMLGYQPTSYYKSIMPCAQAEGLGLYPGWVERKTGAFDVWDEAFQKYANAKYIGNHHNMIPFNIFSNPKIEKLEDFKGLVLRCQPFYIPLFEALGASAVMTPAPDVYTAMERGTVDGFMWPKYGPTGFAWQEVTKYRLDPGVFQMGGKTSINLDKWNSIPKDLQDIIMHVSADMEYIGTSDAFYYMENEWKVMEAAGMEILTMSPEDNKEFREIAYDVTWKQVIADDPEYGPRLKEALNKAP